MQHQTLKVILKKNRSSLTASRLLVFDLLSSGGPQGMQSLIAKAKSDLDRATVYRTVELFEKLGIVHRLNIGMKYKLELSDLFSGHHHHLHCSKCGKTIDLPANPMLETMIDTLSAKTNFAQRSHSLEIYGLCAICQRKKS